MGLCASNTLDQQMEITLTFVKYGYSGDVKKLMGMIADKRVHPDAQDRFGMTALHWAAYGGKVECAQALLKAGASVAVTDNNGRNALHHACRKDQEGMVAFLVKDAGVNVNSVSESKDTPLHKAVIGKSVQCVDLLLRLGADPHLRNDQNRTPLEELDADPDSATDEMYESIAASRMNGEQLRQFLPSKSNIERKDSNDSIMTPVCTLPRKTQKGEDSNTFRYSLRTPKQDPPQTTVPGLRSENSTNGLSCSTADSTPRGSWMTLSGPAEINQRGNKATILAVNFQGLRNTESRRPEALGSFETPSLSVAWHSTSRSERNDSSQPHRTKKSMKYAGKRVIMALRVSKVLTNGEKRKVIRLLFQKHMASATPLDRNSKDGATPSSEE